MHRNRIVPEPGQESVWDYPRPPRVEDTPKHIQVVFNGILIAETRRAKRILETSHPPNYYIPPEDIEMTVLTRTDRTSWCEWKGQATYYTVQVKDKIASNAAWAYPAPAPGYEGIRDYISFYPQGMDACYVDGEKVTPQPGQFYGGWITHDIAGPFKGGPGTMGW